MHRLPTNLATSVQDPSFSFAQAKGLPILSMTTATRQFLAAQFAELLSAYSSVKKDLLLFDFRFDKNPLMLNASSLVLLSITSRTRPLQVATSLVCLAALMNPLYA